MFIISFILALAFVMVSIFLFVCAASTEKLRKMPAVYIGGAFCGLCAVFFSIMLLRYGGCIPPSEQRLTKISEDCRSEIELLYGYSEEHHGFLIDTSGLSKPYRENDNSPAETLPAEIEAAAEKLALCGITKIRAFDSGVLLYSPNFSRMSGTTCGLFYGEVPPLDEQVATLRGRKTLRCDSTGEWLWIFTFQTA